jgi:PAS domain S-box-containing protein
MRIKTQFLISIITFSTILIIIGASVAVTQQQIAELNNKEAIAHNVQTGASDLSYISNNYFLYQLNSSISLWQTKVSTLSDELSALNSSNPQQQALFQTVNGDIENLKIVFAGVTSFLANAPRNVSIRILPSFQTQWNRMAVQIQSLSFDSQQLSQAIRTQTNQVIQVNTILTFALMVAFGAFFIIIYLINYRGTLRSISELKNGIEVLGSGNLDYSVEAGKNDEIEDISKSVNQMAINLKTVTASKTDLERAQTALRESEQRWATTLASIGDAVIATDTSGKIVFMNGEAEKLTGWTLNEASQKSVKTIFNIVNEQTRQEVESPTDRVLKEGVVVGLANHTVLIRKDGTEVPIDDSGAPIKDQEGKTTGVVLIFRNITERKKAEEESVKAFEQTQLREAEVSALLMAAKSVLQNRDFKSSARVIFNSCKELLRATSGYVALLSDDGKDNIVLFLESGGIPCNVDPSLPMPIRGLRALAYNTGKVTVENSFPDSEWTRFLPKGHVDLKNVLFSPLKVDGRTVGIMGLANKPGGFTRHDAEIGMAFGDIASIALINSNMIEMLEENQKKLTAYSENLEALVEEKTKMLKNAERLAAIGATAGMVGHDIRNPLQAITSDVYLAKSDLSPLEDSEEKKNALESLSEIENNVIYINKIVQDLQDFARPLNPIAKETNLKNLIEDLVKKNGIPKHIKVGIKVQNKAVHIVADPEIIRRALANLVNNAVQAMPEGGKLNIQANKETNDTVITVQDTGVGIPEEVRPKLFTPLFTTKSKGQGFGLAVVKRMTESMGGTVTFESELGKGTKFIIRLPSTNK